MWTDVYICKQEERRKCVLGVNIHRLTIAVELIVCRLSIFGVQDTDLEVDRTLDRKSSLD